MGYIYEEFANFAGGVNTSARADQLKELGAYPRGRNTALKYIGPGLAAVGTRNGLTLVNYTQADSGSVIGQFDYRRYTGNSFAPYHILITSLGKMYVINDASQLVTPADASNPTPFTAGTNLPAMVVANNLLYICNGNENKTFNGTNIQSMGITTPSAPTVTDSGIASASANGAYDFAITYYNSSKGQESSLSGFNSVTVANKKINVSWVAPTDTQVDTVRIYIRKGILSGSFFLMTVGSVPLANANGGFATSTTSTVVDISDAQINALLTVAPSTTGNNPPPILDRMHYFQGRLFAVSTLNPSTLIYSNLSSVGLEGFDPSNTIPVNVSDGDRIMAIESTDELLLIFKEHSIYMLVGTYPNWDLRLISDEIGCVGHRAITTVNNVTYFWSLLGPASFTVGNSPELMGQKTIANIVDQNAINYSLLSNIVIGFDYQNLRILWSLPGINDSRNTFIIPFSIRGGVFESDKWEVIDTASFGTIVDTNNNPQLYYGDYAGRIYKSDVTVFRDGVPSGTTSNTGGTVSYGASTLTDSSAAFFTSGNGLAQLYVYVKDSNGQNGQRKRIGSNTGTIITLDSGLTWDTTPDSTWTYYIGGADFQFDYGFTDIGKPSWKKAFNFLFADVVPPNGVLSASVFVDVYTNFELLTPSRTLSFTMTASGMSWDVDNWDVGLWAGGAPVSHQRLRIAYTGRNILARFRCNAIDSPITVTRIGISADAQTMKS